MKRIFEFSVRNSLFVNLLSVFILLAGLVSLLTLRREAFPNVDYDIVMVQTDYFGATPEEIERLITIELEDELKEVDGIDEINSVSAENISLIVLEIDPDEPDKAKIVNDIQRAVDKADDLPHDAEDPLVTEIKSKNFPVINVSLSGIKDEFELQRLARKMELSLLELKDVAKIERVGWRDREIWVEVDPSKVGDYRLALEDIILALRRKNLNLPGGTLKTPEQEYLIRTMGEFDNAEEIRKVIIRANDRGNWIRVEDVAEVQDTFEDDDVIEKTYGAMAINLTIVKKSKGDIINLVRDVKRTAEEFKKSAPPELRISYFDDYSFYVKRRLSVLTNNGMVGLVLVVFALLIFLSRTMAIMTAIGIPIAVFATFFIMQAMGMTINLITMFGLIMVLGMVVDDAIVVTENVYRNYEDGLSAREAVVKGASEVALPVVSTVLTTIVAFIPLMFMSGIMGKFIASIPVVVIIALSASLFECFIILPAHLSDTMRFVSRENKQDKQKWFLGIRSQYMNLLKWVIHHRYKAVGAFAVCFVGAIILYISFMRFVLFPQGLIEEFFIRARAPVGVSLEQMEERMRSFEKIVAELPPAELDNYVTQIGLVREDVSDPYTDRGSHIAQIHVYLTPEQTRDRRMADEIIDDLRQKSQEFQHLFEEVTFSKVRAGPPVGKPVSVRVRGDDFQTMERYAEELKKKLMQMEGVHDIRDDFELGKKEIRIDVDEEKAARAFLSIEDIATAVRNAIDGGEATTIQKTDEEIDVIVKFPEKNTHSRDVFDYVHVPNLRGDLIPLSKIAELKESEGLNVIKHYERKRMINVTAELDEKRITPMAVEKELMTFIRGELRDRYPGVLVSFGGEQEETKESLQDFLRALILALFLIFVILAANFNSIIRPLIVMMAIPFGIVGVIIAFFLHGQPLSFMALLGVIGLSGVVVNDSIVLVDFIYSNRRKGMGRFESILEAGKLRLRAVMMTTLTTVAGLMPVAYGVGGGDPFLKPMALAISWGLLFSTALTLVLIPCLYSISDDVSEKLQKFKDRFSFPQAS